MKHFAQIDVMPATPSIDAWLNADDVQWDRLMRDKYGDEYETRSFDDYDPWSAEDGL